MKHVRRRGRAGGAFKESLKLCSMSSVWTTQHGGIKAKTHLELKISWHQLPSYSVKFRYHTVLKILGSVKWSKQWRQGVSLSRSHISEQFIVRKGDEWCGTVTITTNGWTSQSNPGDATITSQRTDPERHMKGSLSPARALNEAHPAQNERNPNIS